jgi:hypothetical protein
MVRMQTHAPHTPLPAPHTPHPTPRTPLCLSGLQWGAVFVTQAQASQAVRQSASQYTQKQSVSQSVNQSISQSVNQSISQSVNQAHCSQSVKKHSQSVRHASKMAVSQPVSSKQKSGSRADNHRQSSPAPSSTLYATLYPYSTLYLPHHTLHCTTHPSTATTKTKARYFSMLG